jgi:hypothetical protein
LDNLRDYNANKSILGVVKVKLKDDLEKAAVVEAIYSYHKAYHHQSCASFDCDSKLFPIMFSGCQIAETFASKHSKTAAIIKSKFFK